MQVGLAFLLVAYVLVILLWLAYRGESFGKVQLPGGIGADLKSPDPEVEHAADAHDAFKRRTDATLAVHEDTLALLADLVEGNQPLRKRLGRRVRQVLFDHGEE